MSPQKIYASNIVQRRYVLLAVGILIAVDVFKAGALAQI